jgi:prepilin-type N-terminal cleavage/methylation domain-containing protein
MSVAGFVTRVEGSRALDRILETLMSARTHSYRSSVSPSRGFTLIELLVAMGLIVLLAGILLVALNQVRETARKTQTEASLRAFSDGCTSFALEHGSYPGVVPDSHLAYVDTANNSNLDLTSTQNALLHLMGGYRVATDLDQTADNQRWAEFEQFMAQAQEKGTIYTPPSGNVPMTFVNEQADRRTWYLVVDLAKFGEGPVISGKPYPPYFSPKESELDARRPTEPAQAANEGINGLPNLIDAWGQPVIYFRSNRQVGPLARQDIAAWTDTELPQFDGTGLDLYLHALALGKQQTTQARGSSMGEWAGSRLADSAQEEWRTWLTLMLVNPSLYDFHADSDDSDFWYGQSRGRFMVVSSGPDGVFLARSDGPVDENGDFVTSVSEIRALVREEGVQDVISEFDDLRMFGGS